MNVDGCEETCGRSGCYGERIGEEEERDGEESWGLHFCGWWVWLSEDWNGGWFLEFFANLACMDVTFRTGIAMATVDLK